MKIAYLVPSNTLSGGLRVVLQQAEELATRGHSATIVSPDPGPEWLPLKRARWERSPFGSSKALATADIRIATFWTTVNPAVQDLTGPVFHLCQGYEADFSFYGHVRAEIEAAYARATHKLAITPHVAARLKASGCEQVTYIGQTFDPQEFPPAKNRRFDRDRPRILLVGIFEADVKGIREALEALARMRRMGARFSLCRISTQPRSIEEKALFRAESHHVCLTPGEMAMAYRDSDLLIGPSHPEEGFGLPVIEALSSGLPALLSDTPGHRHIAGEAAEYFSCADSSNLSMRAERLLQDPSRRAELSAGGPVEAARFKTEEVVDKMLAAFVTTPAKQKLIPPH